MQKLLVLLLFCIININVCAQISISTDSVDHSFPISQHQHVDINTNNIINYSKKIDYRNDTIDKITVNFFISLSKTSGVMKASIFSNYVLLSGSFFSSEADFSLSTFSKYVTFSGATFSKSADFEGSTFLDKVNFGLTTFSNNLGFASTNFKGTASFFGAQFLKGADFNSAAFHHYVDFNRARFSGTINFAHATFKSKNVLNLNNINLVGGADVDFYAANLPDTILFSENNEISHVNFTDANFSAKNFNPISIYLYKTDISKLHFDYIHFKLLLAGSIKDFNGSRKIVLSTEEVYSMYDAVLNNFKKNGQSESYKLCDVEFQQYKWNNSWTGALFCLPKWWWNFGYDKEYIFYWVIIFLLFFTGITYFYIYNLNTLVYPIETIPTNLAWQKKTSLFDFKQRLWFSFIYVSVVFFNLSLKIGKLQFKEKKGISFVILIHIAGLICIGYMANFVLQK